MPSFCSPPSRIGLRKATGEAVLSPMMPAVVGALPVAALASSMMVGSAAPGCRPAGIELWNTYLKPRAVMMSA